MVKHYFLLCCEIIVISFSEVYKVVFRWLLLLHCSMINGSFYIFYPKNCLKTKRFTTSTTFKLTVSMHQNVHKLVSGTAEAISRTSWEKCNSRVLPLISNIPLTNPSVKLWRKRGNGFFKAVTSHSFFFPTKRNVKCKLWTYS